MSSFKEAAKQSFMATLHQTSPPAYPAPTNYKWKTLARVMYKKQSNPQAYYRLWRKED